MIDAVDEAAARTGFSMGYHNDSKYCCQRIRLEHFLVRYLMSPQLVQSLPMRTLHYLASTDSLEEVLGEKWYAAWTRLSHTLCRDHFTLRTRMAIILILALEVADSYWLCSLVGMVHTNTQLAHLDYSILSPAAVLSPVRRIENKKTI
jgi:hypothetical protein